MLDCDPKYLIDSQLDITIGKRKENTVNDNLAYEEEWLEELIDGKLVAMSPAVTNHNRIKRNISTIFDVYLENHPCEVLPDGEAVYLSDTDFYYPDVIVVCDPDKIQPDGVHGAPDLVVEVLSPSTARYDKGRKKNVYEMSGVREYWLVEPANKSVEQWLLKDGRFVLNDVYSIYPDYMLARMKDSERASVATAFKCSLYDDLTIRLKDVFRRVL